MDYQYLSWDTDFFDKKIGRIIPTRLGHDRLSSILAEMRKEGYCIVYWPSDIQCVFDTGLLGGDLVDRKTTFEIDLSKINLNTLPLPQTKPYTNDMPISQLKNLALQSGKFSRFTVDKRFSYENFASLYKTWLQKSVTKEIADEVLVIFQDNHIAGMVSLSVLNAVGRIELIAVDENYRGKKFGQQLVYDSQRWFIENKCHTAQVITQGDNIAACLLYKKCGYQKIKTSYYYHFWL